MNVVRVICLWGLVALLCGLLAGCSPPGSDAVMLAKTMVAETDAAETVAARMAAQLTIAAASPTPSLTATPTPSATLTITPIPSTTPTATRRPTSTVTRVMSPTPSPTITPTPGPTLSPTPSPVPTLVVLSDDFLAGSANWSPCPQCKWAGGQLTMGPYAVEENRTPHILFCEQCGEHPFYHIAVDATFEEGQADRYFGLAFGFGDNKFFTFAIASAYEQCLVAEYDYSTTVWTVINLQEKKQTCGGLVRIGDQTNRLAVNVEPSVIQDRADYYVTINGKTAFVLYSQPLHSSKVGLILDWHSTAVVFDNFEYQEIKP